MKLYVTPPSPRAFKVVAVMHHLALDAELAFVDLLHGDHMKPEFAALNPNRKMPVLEDDGFLLWESNAIMQYLASKRPEAGLWPAEQAPGGRQPLAVLGAGALGAACGRRCSTLSGTLRPGDPTRRGARGRGFHQWRRAHHHLRGRDWLVGRGLRGRRRSGRGSRSRYRRYLWPKAERALVPCLKPPAWQRATVRCSRGAPRGREAGSATRRVQQDAPSMWSLTRPQRRSVLQELLPRVQDPPSRVGKKPCARCSGPARGCCDSTSVGDLKI